MCTVLQMKDKNLVGKNYDAFIESGMIFTNKRGIQKSALIMPPAKPLMWESLYGNLTFSQNGKEMPVSGINEKGLVVEQATMPECQYSENNQDQPVAGCLEMIQYVLDTCCNIEQAISAFKSCSIEKNAWPIHFMLIDEKGEMAIIEFLQGEMKIYKSEITERLMTNSPYEVLCHSLEEKEMDTTNPYKVNSIERFKRGSKLIKQCDPIDVEATFDILKQTRREDTQWQVVYDVKAKCVYFKGKESDKIRKLSLLEIDFSKESQSMQLDFTKTDQTKLEPFKAEDNRKLIETFYNNEQIKAIMHIPEDATSMFIEFIAGQAEKYEKQ